jgi:hypothetical protein
MTVAFAGHVVHHYSDNSQMKSTDGRRTTTGFGKSDANLAPYEKQSASSEM